MNPDKIAELIQAAIDQSNENYTLIEVLEEITSGRAALFVEGESVLVAKLYGRNGQITAHGWLGAGNLDELTDKTMPRAEEWARGQGASRMTVDGRRGWVRALHKGGFKEEMVTVGKSL